jgi:hypothetical protein
MLTTPRSVLKSSTKDLSNPIFEITIQYTQEESFCETSSVLQFYDVEVSYDTLSLFAKHRKR